MIKKTKMTKKVVAKKPMRKMQDGGKTGAQLKKEGQEMKAKGLAMKKQGQQMKKDGLAMKNNPSKGMYDELDTRTKATQIKLRESNVFVNGLATSPSDRTAAQQKILDKDMAIIRAKEAKARAEAKATADAKAADKAKAEAMRNKGGYSTQGFKKGGIVGKSKAKRKTVVRKKK